MKPQNSPVEFARTVLGARLTVSQEDILHALTKDRRIAVKACHASGKTYCAAIAALWFATRYRNSRTLIIAPGWLTVRSVLWHEIHGLLSRARLRLPLEVQNQTEIRLDSSLILGLSTNDSARLQGHHAEHVLIIADEAPGIDESFWPALEGVLSAGDARLLILGNPVTSAGYFHDAFARNAASWEHFTISAFDCPNMIGLTLESLLALPDEELDNNPVPYLITKRWIAERHREWWNDGIENSPLWASRVLGLFPSSSSNGLIPISLLEAARQPAADPGCDVVIGLDIAGAGRDRTVATVCAGGAILETGIWTDSDPRGSVLDFLKRWSHRLRVVRYDSTGLGYYFGEHLRDHGYRAIGCNAASKASDFERFPNSKAEMFWNLRLRFQSGQVSGLSAECLSELAAVQYVIDPHGRTAIEDKASVKSAIGRSPDLAESLALAIGEGAPISYSYTVAQPAASAGLGYGHKRTPTDTARCNQHPWRQSCACLAQREDMPNVRLAGSLRGRGSW